jgi:hypothetical protein
MAKRRSRKRSGGNKFEAVGRAKQLVGALWNDLEQAFFAAAPPDDPGPPPEAPRFDDLLPTAEPERARSRATRLMAAISSAAWTRRRVAVALASVCVLICLFTVIVVLRSADRPRSPVAPTTPATNAGAVKPSSVSSTRPAGAAYGS